MPEPSIDSSLLVGDYLFVAKNSARSQCPPGTYMITHNVSPLTRSIAEDKPFSLSNDTLALALLDSMYSGVDEVTRRFYFWVVSRSLKRSDGYYSEGVGVTGTSHLYERPYEFISSWKNCITKEEREQWVYYLAAEQSITSEGFPADSVLAIYRDSLDQVTKDLPTELIAVRDTLLFQVGRKLQVLKSAE